MAFTRTLAHTYGTIDLRVHFTNLRFDFGPIATFTLGFFVGLATSHVCP